MNEARLEVEKGKILLLIIIIFLFGKRPLRQNDAGAIGVHPEVLVDGISCSDDITSEAWLFLD